MTMVDTREQAKEEASKVLAVVSQELTLLDTWQIEGQEDLDFANDMLRDVKKRHKALEGKRKSITGPMNKALRAVNSLFRPPREALEKAEHVLKDKISGYLHQVEEENTRVMEEASTAEGVESAAALLKKVECVEKPEGITIRHVWKPVVIDELLLDRRFLMPDMDAIKAWTKEHVKADGEPLPIPGVLFERQSVVASRAK